MSEDLTTEIKISADASGVEAGVGKAKRSLADLGVAAQKAGQDAGAGLGSIGAAGQRSAQEVERTTRNFTANLQRQIAAAQAGGTANRQYMESLIRLRGGDVAALKPLLDQLDAAKAKTQAAKSANDELAGSFRNLNGVLAGFGAALSVGGVSTFVKQAIDAADATSKLAQKSGVAVESLRELNYAASLSDVSTEDLATGLRKLSQNMTEAARGSKEQSAAFEAVGVNVKRLDGSLKGADEVLKELASRFASFEDGPAKAALAIELFGKQGAELIPLLNGGAAGLQDMADEARKLGVVFNADLAKSAEQFNDNLTRIRASSEGAAIVIAGQLLPTFNFLTEEFLKSKDGSNSFAKAFGEAVRTVIEASTILGENVMFTLRGLGREFAAIAAQFAALARGDFGQWTVISDALKADNKRAEAELERFHFNLLNAGLLNSKAGAGRGTAPDPRILGVDVTPAPVLKTNNVGKEVLSEYEKLMQRLGIDIPRAAAAAEAAQLGLNKAQEEYLALVGSPVWATFTAQQRENLKNEYEKKIAIETAATAATRLSKATAEAAQAHDKYLVTLDNGLAKIRADVVAQDEATARMGLSKTAVAALDAAKLEMLATDLDLQAIKALDKNLDEAAYIRLREQAAAYRDLAKAKQEGAAREEFLEIQKASEDAARKAQEEWQRAADDINRSLTDALLRGFESGKGFAENLRDTLVNMFKTLVLRPVISAVLSPISGAINGFVGGALGLAGSSAAAASGGSSALGALGAAGSVANLAGGLGGGIMNGLSAWGAGGSVSGVFSNAGLFSGAELLGAGLPILAGVGALFALANATKGETRAGGQYGFGVNGAGVSNRRGTTYSDVNGAFFLEGPSGGDPYQAQAMKGIDDTVAAINARFKGLGSSAAVSNFNAGYESSEKNRGGVFAGGALSSGRQFGESGLGNNYAGTLFESTSTQSPDAATAIKNFATDLLQVSIQALQAEDGLPKVIKDILQFNGKDIVAESLTDEAAAKILEQVDTVIASVNSLTEAAKLLPFEDLANLSFDAAAGLIELAGGIQALGGNLTSFYQTYFSPEEQQAQTRKNVTATLEKVGVDLPATRDEFKELVLSFMAMGEAGQPALAALLSVNQAFASITEAANDATESLKAQADAARQSAFTALQQAAQVEKGLLDARRDVLSQSIGEKQSLAGVLGSNVRDLRGQAIPQAVATDGKQFIAQALATAKATGYLPDNDLLTQAISGARGGIAEGAYGSQFEQDRERLVLAGQLSQLEEINGKQLTFEEQQLKAVERQVKALEETVEFWQQQIDLSTQGIEATLSVVDAVEALKKLMFPDKKPTTPTTPTSGGAVFGGGSGPSVVDPGVVDENGLRTYADGSTQQLSENELYLYRKFGNKPIPYYDVGTNRVPNDGLAFLHKDEAVIPKAFNPYLHIQSADPRDGRGESFEDLVKEVKGLRTELASVRMELEQIGGDADQLARQFDKVTSGGGFMRTKEIA
jgi:hypothetical protein